MRRGQAAHWAHCWVTCLGRVDRRRLYIPHDSNAPWLTRRALSLQMANSDRRSRAILTISAMLGAINLSRAVSDPNLSREILQRTRDQLISLNKTRETALEG